MLTSACGADNDAGPEANDLLEVDPTDDPMYLGDVADTDAIVAVMLRPDGDADIYVSGGPETLATHTRWFFAKNLVVQGQPTYADSDAWFLLITRRDPLVTGTLTSPDGELTTVEAELVGDDTRIGIFQEPHSSDRCGAIVWQTGDEPVRIQGAHCDDEGLPISSITALELAPPAPNLATIRVRAGEVDDENAPVVLMVNSQLL